MAAPSDENASPPPSNNAIQAPIGVAVQPAYDTVQQLQSNLTSSPEESVVLCADGKGPLLEGEERVFPCAGQCPAGFECEFVRGPNEGGICCPNLSELYRLYNEEEESGEATGNGEENGGEQREEKGTTMADQQQDLGVNAMALLEQHYAGAIARPRPKPRSTPPSEPETAALVRSRSVEIRRTQPRWQGLTEANIWRPKAHAVRPAIGLKRGGNDASGEEYSCRRQRLELFCEDGRRRTQFVMRWYAKENRCVTYPWGYCPGEPVASDRTLRTREECELLCTDPLDAGHDSSVVNVVRFGIGDGELPKVQQFGRQEDELELLKASTTGSSSSSQHQQSSTGNGEKGREVEEGGKGQSSPIAAVAAVPNQEVVPDLSAVDSAGPEPIDLSAAPSDSSPGDPPPPSSGQSHQQSPPSSSSAELAEFLLADQRPRPKRKRCEKVSPYRAMCPQDGMPSQFTLRWYQRGQACFAYPYGYCHGESVYAEEPIKTERECLALCVQKRESTRGLAGLLARRRRF